MEETRTTIHSGLTRCNKFLRENPQWCQIVAPPFQGADAAPERGRFVTDRRGPNEQNRG
jgi:hypothetical protein